MRRDKKTELLAPLLAHTSSKKWKLTPLPLEAAGKPREEVSSMEPGALQFLILGAGDGGGLRWAF